MAEIVPLQGFLLQERGTTSDKASALKEVWNKEVEECRRSETSVASMSRSASTTSIQTAKHDKISLIDDWNSLVEAIEESGSSVGSFNNCEGENINSIDSTSSVFSPSFSAPLPPFALSSDIQMSPLSNEERQQIFSTPALVSQSALLHKIQYQQDIQKEQLQHQVQHLQRFQQNLEKMKKTTSPSVVSSTSSQQYRIPVTSLVDLLEALSTSLQKTSLNETRSPCTAPAPPGLDGRAPVNATAEYSRTCSPNYQSGRLPSDATKNLSSDDTQARAEITLSTSHPVSHAPASNDSSVPILQNEEYFGRDRDDMNNTITSPAASKRPMAANAMSATVSASLNGSIQPDCSDNVKKVLDFYGSCTAPSGVANSITKMNRLRALLLGGELGLDMQGQTYDKPSGVQATGSILGSLGCCHDGERAAVASLHHGVYRQLQQQSHKNDEVNCSLKISKGDGVTDVCGATATDTLTSPLNRSDIGPILPVVEELQRIEEKHVIPASALTPDLLTAIPKDKNGNFLSAGSIMHNEGQCKPCVFHMNPNKYPEGCMNGFRCLFCHSPHEIIRKRPRWSKKKRDLVKAIQRGEKQRNNPNNSGNCGGDGLGNSCNGISNLVSTDESTVLNINVRTNLQMKNQKNSSQTSRQMSSSLSTSMTHQMNGSTNEMLRRCATAQLQLAGLEQSSMSTSYPPLPSFSPASSFSSSPPSTHASSSSHIVSSLGSFSSTLYHPEQPFAEHQRIRNHPVNAADDNKYDMQMSDVLLMSLQQQRKLGRGRAQLDQSEQPLGAEKSNIDSIGDLDVSAVVNHLATLRAT